jgi:hypothetical protein
MRIYASTVALVASLCLITPYSSGFTPSRVAIHRQPINDVRLYTKSIHPLHSTTTENDTTTPSSSTPMKKKKKLGLITFDLDDTLYPIAPVLDEANTAFSTAMSNFGYVDIAPSDIVEAGKIIRSQVTEDKEGAGVDPLKPATVNHKEIRLAAIRKEMEQFILRTKLKQTAADWATDVEDLTSPVKKSAEK